MTQQNNAFATEMAADIVWTFNVPAMPNAEVLEHADYLLVSGWKRYAAQVWWDGYLVAGGSLWIQTAEQDGDLQCGLTLNEAAAGFGSRWMSENDYGEPVEIADRITRHRDGWRQLLLASLVDDSPVKFFLSRCDKFYQENDDYGCHAGAEYPVVYQCGETGYLNRLLYTMQGEPGSETPVLNENHLFNEGAAEKFNGFCFCPALRLDWLLRATMRNAGLNVTGGFLESGRVQDMYIQSLNAMDGDATQYEVENRLVVRNAREYSNAGTGQLFFKNDTDETYRRFTNTNNKSVEYHLALDDTALAGGTFPDGSDDYAATHYHFKRYNEVYFLAAKRIGGGGYPTVRIKATDCFGGYRYGVRLNETEAEWDQLSFPVDQYATAFMDVETRTGRIKIHGTTILGQTFEDYISPYQGSTTDWYMIQLSDTPNNPVRVVDGDGYHAGVDGRGFMHWTAAGAGSHSTSPFALRLYRARVLSCSETAQGIPLGVYENGEQTRSFLINSTSGMPSGYSHAGTERRESELDYDRREQIQFLDQWTEIDPLTERPDCLPLNIFNRFLDYTQHVPHITNSQFVGTLRDFFGLCVYFGTHEGEVQMEFFADVFNTGAIDVTKYVTGRVKLNQDPTRYTVKLEPLKAEHRATGRYTLGDALDYANHEAVHGDADHNRRRQSLLRAYKLTVQSRDDNGVWRWTPAGGDGRERQFLPGETNFNLQEQQVTPGAKVPNMSGRLQTGDASGSENQYWLQELDTQGVSEMFDEEYTGEFPMVLVQRAHGGNNWLNVHPTGAWAWYETAVPVNTAATSQYNRYTGLTDLSVEGDGSVGDLWLAPLYEFLTTAEPCRLELRMPTIELLQLMRLLRPQQGEQTRWVMCDGRRYLPTQIEYHLGSGRLTEVVIDCLREGY